MNKQINFKIKGMQKDLSESAFNPEFAFENKNIRITPTKDNTLLSITNEKGNKYAPLIGTDDIIGTPIGQAILDNELIVFSTGSLDGLYHYDIQAAEKEIPNIQAEDKIIDQELASEDRIYKIWGNKNKIEGDLLYKGNLNFRVKHPIESIVSYENDSIKKVYWTDGINQPRVINISTEELDRKKWNDKSFDFVRTLGLKENIEIKRNLTAGGVFSPGVIQYAFTYISINGQESNIFYISPLYYLSYANRGASPEEKVSNSFTIKISKLDTSFDFVRIYSIHRTSINGTPEVKRVSDIFTKSGSSIFTDNGTVGDLVDPTELLYVGGEEVTIGTLAQKDNTLFCGNYKLQRRIIDSDIKSKLSNGKITFSTIERGTDTVPSTGFYPYKNQLNKDANTIKSFKYLEEYRFGVQFQHYTGKWSEPIWINDATNDKAIWAGYANQTPIMKIYASYILNKAEVISSLVESGYIRVRGVVVYPTISERNCVCQGILCPTVFNVEDRFDNSPFVQSSWFARATSAFTGGNWEDRDKPNINPSENSAAGVLNNDTFTVISENKIVADGVSKGAFLEYKHYTAIPGNDNRNAEIQCISNPNPTPFTTKNTQGKDYVDLNKENYYVDQSIFTMHSPEIEFDSNFANIDLSNLKLRIVGVAPVTGFKGDIDIQTSTPPNMYKDSTQTALGFYKEPIEVENISRFGWRGIVSGYFWLDEITERKNSNSDKYSTAFAVYPWHRNGSLNNTSIAKDGYKSAMLQYKKLSNLRFSYNTYYLPKNEIWNAYVEGDDDFEGISGAVLFNSNEKELIKIPAPKNSTLSDIIYYGNVDKIVVPSRLGAKSKGYPIVASTVKCVLNKDLFRQNFSDSYLTTNYTDQINSVDPVRIKYKSTPHVVMALNYTKSKWQKALPSLIGRSYNYTQDVCPFWDKDAVGFKIDRLDVKFPIQTSIFGNTSEYGFFWVGELYRDNTADKFGGKTEEAFENNQWVPCGESISLVNQLNKALTSVTIKWTGGDTYYQRYDNIKTYPFTLKDQNSVTDVVSFMCETRINIDGRYDRNRGSDNLFTITPENFNKVNSVYSQEDNFFVYRGLNINKGFIDKFPNSITWTKTKSAGALVDTWTNITLASTLDLDGDKGEITALKRFANNIIAFQDKGISQILYNDNVQISSTQGIPIEIANSGKVQGKRYLSESIGCPNKWSICETPNGLYFIDSITKGIYTFNGKLDNLSNRLGLHSWINNNTDDIAIWNPFEFRGFVSYYDKINNEVLFISNKDCLAYSEYLGQFTSFYSYERTPYMANINDFNLAIRKDSYDERYKIWVQHEGDYNMYYGKFKPFYTTVIANPDMQRDKIFNNVEFRADSWDSNDKLKATTFDTLEVWNEYQYGKQLLKYIKDMPSSLKKKFRIWRANVPRDASNHRDRIRNPWAYVKLSCNTFNTNKTVLHDIVVHYFE